MAMIRAELPLQVDVPAFDWPAAPFPNIKYPLAENEEHNKAEEIRCLKAYEKILIDRYARDVTCQAESTILILLLANPRNQSLLLLSNPSYPRAVTNTPRRPFSERCV